MDNFVESSTQETAHWIYDPNGMDWGLSAWRCDNCGFRNDLIPTHIRGKEDKMIKVENPFEWAGSRYCANCGREMVSKE